LPQRPGLELFFRQVPARDSVGVDVENRFQIGADVI
jgi:hypothetical protein